MAGREDYEERRAARIDRLNAASEKAQERSTQLSNESSRMISAIPMGQPIITGRGSRTTADINYRERAWNKMGKSVEESEKASYYADRAASAESNTAISSDDPEALQKLHDKLAALELNREEIKEENKRARAAGGDPNPSWVLSNLGAEIRRMKDRIKLLERMDSRPAMEDIPFDGGVIHENVEMNRLQIIFDDIPDADVRARLKSWGFRWARSAGAWQRLRGPGALGAAKAALKIPAKKEAV